MGALLFAISFANGNLKKLGKFKIAGSLNKLNKNGSTFSNLSGPPKLNKNRSTFSYLSGPPILNNITAFFI